MRTEARRIIDSGRFVQGVVGDVATVRPQQEAPGLPVEVRAAPWAAGRLRWTKTLWTCH